MIKLNNPSMEDWFDIWAAHLFADYIEEVYTQDQIKSFELAPAFKVNQSYTKIIYANTPREQHKRIEKVKEVFSSVTYKPDRVIVWKPKANGIFHTPYEDVDWFKRDTFFISHKNKGKNISLVDVKAPASFRGNSSDVSFSIMQRLLHHFHKIYVNKAMIMPYKKFKNKNAYDKYLFSATFTPARYFYTDKLTKRRTITNWKPLTLRDFIYLKTRSRNTPG